MTREEKVKTAKGLRKQGFSLGEVAKFLGAQNQLQRTIWMITHIVGGRSLKRGCECCAKQAFVNPIAPIISLEILQIVLALLPIERLNRDRAILWLIYVVLDYNTLVD